MIKYKKFIVSFVSAFFFFFSFSNFAYAYVLNENGDLSEDLIFTETNVVDGLYIKSDKTALNNENKRNITNAIRSFINKSYIVNYINNEPFYIYAVPSTNMSSENFYTISFKSLTLVISKSPINFLYDSTITNLYSSFKINQIGAQSTLPIYTDHIDKYLINPIDDSDFYVTTINVYDGTFGSDQYYGTGLSIPFYYNDIDNAIFAHTDEFYLNNSINDPTKAFNVTVTPEPKLEMKSSVEITGTDGSTAPNGGLSVDYNKLKVKVETIENFDKEKYYANYCVFITDVDPATWTEKNADGFIFAHEELLNDSIIYIAGKERQYISDRYSLDTVEVENENMNYKRDVLATGFCPAYLATGLDNAEINLSNIKIQKNKSYWLIVMGKIGYVNVDAVFDEWKYPHEIDTVDFTYQDESEDIYQMYTNLIYQKEFSFTEPVEYLGNSDLPQYNFDDAFNQEPKTLITNDGESFMYDDYKHSDFDSGFSNVDDIDGFLSNIKNGMTNLTAFMTTTFFLLPAPIPELLISGFIIIITGGIVIALFKFIRG